MAPPTSSSRRPTRSPPDLFVDDAGPSLAGTRVGPYLVRQEIGRGGMGVVYLADDTRLSRRVALKAIAPGFQADSGRRERLRQEARAAAALSHPGIATVYAIEEIDDELYLACEYVAGPTLRALIESGPVPAVLVLDLATQLARALAAAHAQGVVHRDLKPENIVRTASGAIKVLDFGVARIENIGRCPADGRRRRAPSARRRYMSPEQIRREEVDFRTDLFSFGVLLYEMATGDESVRRGNGNRVDRPHSRNRSAAAAVQSIRARPGLDRIVSRCLRKRREDRYESTLALVHDLEQLHRNMRSLGQSGSAGRQPRRRTLRQAAHHITARWWWECHQVVASVVYALMIYPAWHARLWISKPWNMFFFFALLAAAATAVSVRLHLFFTSRSYPSELSFQRARAVPWTRSSDTVFAAGSPAGRSGHRRRPLRIAALLLAVSLAATVSMLIIEPATARAAFSEETPR